MGWNNPSLRIRLYSKKLVFLETLRDSSESFFVYLTFRLHKYYDLRIIKKGGAMNDPLSVDKKIVEEFGLTGVEELDPEKDFKMAYLTEQLNQLKMMLFRSRVDLILTENLLKSDNEAIQAKGNENRTQFRNDIRQTAGAIQTILKLRDQVKKG